MCRLVIISQCTWIHALKTLRPWWVFLPFESVPGISPGFLNNVGLLARAHWIETKSSESFLHCTWCLSWLSKPYCAIRGILNSFLCSLCEFDLKWKNNNPKTLFHFFSPIGPLQFVCAKPWWGSKDFIVQLLMLAGIDPCMCYILLSAAILFIPIQLTYTKVRLVGQSIQSFGA